jgi:WD40 repeat protein
MARVVCQVLASADRFTLIWSEGEAAFAPYGIESPQAAEVHRLAAEAQEKLAHLGAVAAEAAAPAATGHQLAQTGHALYRLLFQDGQPAGAPGQEVRAWLEQLTRQGAVESLDIVGDSLSVPWSVVCVQAPDQTAFEHFGSDGWKGFWGRRHGLFGGRRVPGLRTLPAKPSVVLAIDQAVRSTLSHEDQKRLSDFLDKYGPVVTESKQGLAKLFRAQQFDLLYIFGRADGSKVYLGSDRLTPADLQRILHTVSEDAAGIQAPLVVLNPVHDAERASTGNVLSAFQQLNGNLVGAWQPLAAAVAHRCGLELLEQLLLHKKPMAQAVSTIHAQQPAAALLFFACCSADLRLLSVGDGDGENNITAESAPALDNGREPYPLPDDPYRLLAPLGIDEAALLAGREADIPDVAGLLDESATRLLLIHGAAGAGKSSLLQAGVVPFLEDECIGYRMRRDRSGEGDMTDEFAYPVVAVRATSDLAGQLALALCAFCARPLTYTTPSGQPVVIDLPALLASAVAHNSPPIGNAAIKTGEMPSAPSPQTMPDAENVRKALRDEPDLLGRILAALTQGLPFELVLLVEQADDLFSLQRSGGNDYNLQGSLAMLRAILAVPARAKLVLSLRTEYLGRLFDAIAQTPEDGQHVRTFLTRELTEEQLVEVILQPTSAEPLPNTEEVPLDKYGFQFEQGLAETIAAEAVKFGGQNQESVLVLTHVICARLFQLIRQRTEKVIRAADLKSIGGVEKGLSKYVASMLKASSTSRDKRALTTLFLELFIRQPDGSLTRDLLFQEDIKAKWLGTTPLEQLAPTVAAAGVRLLEVSWLNVSGKEGHYLSLGHDALAPVAAQHAEETTRRAYGWTKMGDALWITVPLLILLGVFAWRQISALSSANTKMEEQGKDFQDFFEKMKKQSAENAEANQSMQWPAYLGQIRAAEQAYLAGDMVRMRQALLAAKSSPRAADELPLRGFEWYYLWGLMRQDRATLLGHLGPVTAVAVAPDGQTAASAGADGIVRLWDVTRGEQLFKIEITVDKVPVAINGLAFSPDGSMLAAAQDNKVVRVWRVTRLEFSQVVNLVLAPVSALLHDIGPLVNLTFQSNKVREDSVKDSFELSDHTAPVLAVAFSPDSKTLAAACKDNVVLLWDLSGAKPALRHTLKEHTGPVLALAWSNDGTRLATGAADNLVHIWDAKTGKKETTLPKHASEVAALAWSPDGKTLASGSSDKQGGYAGGIVKLFDTMSWKERSLPKLQVAPVLALAFTAKGTLVIAGKDNAIRVCDAASGEELQVLKGHLGWVPSVALAKGGEILVSGSFDGTVKIWEPELLTSRNLLKVSNTPVAAVLFAADDRSLATGSGDGLVKLWDVATGKALKTLAGSQKGAVLALAWGAEGKTLISGGSDGMLRLWDTDPNSATFGTELDKVEAHAKEVACLSSADSGKTLASASTDGSVKVWGFEGTKFAKNPVDIKTEGGAVHCLALRDGGGLLVTGHEDGKVRLWNPTTGKAADFKTITLSGHTARVTGVALPANKDFLLTTSADRTIRFWSIKDGKELVVRRGHAGPVTGLTISTDDRSFVTGSVDHTVKVWDPLIERQEDRITLIGHTGPVRAVALSADRRIIASAGQDGTVRLWRAVASEANPNLPLRVTP